MAIGFLETIGYMIAILGCAILWYKFIDADKTKKLKQKELELEERELQLKERYAEKSHRNKDYDNDQRGFQSFSDGNRR